MDISFGYVQVDFSVIQNDKTKEEGVANLQMYHFDSLYHFSIVKILLE